MSLRTALSSKRAKVAYLIAASSFVLLVLSDAFLLPWIIHSRAEIAIPDLVGMPLAKAEQLLLERDLQPVLAGNEASDTYPPGRVIFMDPAPKSIVREGRNVYLTVSGGEETVVVPNLRGRSLRDVKIALEQIDLRVGLVTYQPSQLPVESVIAQSTPAGRAVQRRSAIDIAVSSGPEAMKLDMPYLVSLSFEQAQQVLRDLGLRLGAVTYRDSESLLPNTVMSQYPAAGVPVDPGTAVDLTLAQ